MFREQHHHDNIRLCVDKSSTQQLNIQHDENNTCSHAFFFFFFFFLLGMICKCHTWTYRLTTKSLLINNTVNIHSNKLHSINTVRVRCSWLAQVSLLFKPYTDPRNRSNPSYLSSSSSLWVKKNDPDKARLLAFKSDHVWVMLEISGVLSNQFNLGQQHVWGKATGGDSRGEAEWSAEMRLCSRPWWSVLEAVPQNIDPSYLALAKHQKLWWISPLTHRLCRDLRRPLALLFLFVHRKVRQHLNLQTSGFSKTTVW